MYACAKMTLLLSAQLLMIFLSEPAVFFRPALYLLILSSLLGLIFLNLIHLLALVLE